MTGPTREHDRYDEMAAGYALHALDTGEERQFLAHLPGCPRCQAALSDFTEVAAGLADNWLAVEPSPQLGERIMAAVMQDPALAERRARNAADQTNDAQTEPASPAQADSRTGPDSQAHADGQAHPDGEGERPGATVTGLAERRRRRRLRAIVASAAAAVALIAGGATWRGLSDSGRGPQAPTAGCVNAGTCREVQLTDARSHAPAAKVIVTGGTVWLIPSGLPADDAAKQVYVLWQITGTRAPLAVGSFDVSGRQDGPVRIGKLAVPYRGTRAFAVSIEHGRTIPATPSHPVASGQILS